MENYYFDLSRLPEKFNNDTVKKFMEQHKFHVYESSKAPKNKHIGSGAWHDDVIAFLEENAPVEVTSQVDAKAEIVIEPIEWFDSKADAEHKEFVDELQGKKPKKKAAKKVAEAPNPTDNNGVA